MALVGSRGGLEGGCVRVEGVEGAARHGEAGPLPLGEVSVTVTVGW